MLTSRRLTPCALWFTGLSGAGKSTLAALVAQRLEQAGCDIALLDGDVVRRTLSRDLGYSDEDRRENIRRLGELARQSIAEGKLVLVAAISPLRDARQEIRETLPAGQFVEIFVDSPLSVCEARDPKGLYRKARQGVIRQFTGIDSAYEAPLAPELHLHTDLAAPDECADQVVQLLQDRQRRRLVNRYQHKS